MINGKYKDIIFDARTRSGRKVKLTSKILYFLGNTLMYAMVAGLIVLLIISY